ncbi:SH3 domain-containing protein [Streptomyces xanthophaeus]|uniref:hypothetical protein n=1 Tax=Streptomyces xanthophaeus TaxID=67385 RepID=UPI0037132941
MHRTVIPAVLAALTLLPALPAAAAPTAPVPAAVAAWNSCGYHPVGNVKLRTRPGGPGLGLLTDRDTVTVLAEREGWYQVETQGKSETGLAWGTRGWVAKKHVTPAVCMRLN